MCDRHFDNADIAFEYGDSDAHLSNVDIKGSKKERDDTNMGIDEPHQIENKMKTQEESPKLLPIYVGGSLAVIILIIGAALGGETECPATECRSDRVPCDQVPCDQVPIETQCPWRPSAHGDQVPVRLSAQCDFSIMECPLFFNPRVLPHLKLYFAQGPNLNPRVPPSQT